MKTENEFLSELPSVFSAYIKSKNELKEIKEYYDYNQEEYNNNSKKIEHIITCLKENEINIDAFEKDLSDLIYLIGANNNLLEKINYQKNSYQKRLDVYNEKLKNLNDLLFKFKYQEEEEWTLNQMI